MSTDFSPDAPAPDPENAPALFESVLTRRVSAFLIDCVIMAVLLSVTLALSGVLGFLTLGLAWLAMPLIMVVVYLGYYAATMGSAAQASWGMRVMDLVVAPTRDTRFDGGMAVLHVVLFWLSTSFLTPFILLVGWFTPRRQLLHDLVTGTMMVRRAPARTRKAQAERAAA